MIMRSVFFRAVPGKEAALTDQLARNIAELRPLFPGILEISTGAKLVGDAPYTNGVVIKFTSMEALKLYESHPAHFAAIAKIEGMYEGRISLGYEID